MVLFKHFNVLYWSRLKTKRNFVIRPNGQIYARAFWKVCDISMSPTNKYIIHIFTKLKSSNETIGSYSFNTRMIDFFACTPLSWTEKTLCRNIHYSVSQINDSLLLNFCAYSRNKIRKTQNEHLNIVCQNLIGL